jgi:transposase
MVGVDLAKNVFGVHAVDSRGAVVVRKMILRRHLLKFFGRLPPCLVGMEACNSSHYWAREIAKQGHEVRLMSPQFVKPYRKTNKNDQNDAEAICEAVGRPSMRFVPVKSLAQQDLQAVHRVREQLLKTRTALANQMRALLRERGVVIPQRIGRLRKALPAVLADREELLSGMFKELLTEIAERLRDLDERITRHERRIAQLFHADERCKRLSQIEGVGPLAAPALVAAVGNAQDFKSARQSAPGPAWCHVSIPAATKNFC